MKLASYQDGSRDGQLVVVSRDLTSAHYATGVATRLQQVLDDWNFLSPQLETLSQSLNHGKARHAFAFDPTRCLAPLPRAYLWIDGAEHENGDPPTPGASRLRRGASDRFLAPRAEIECGDGAVIDVEAKLAAIVGDVAADASAGSALECIRLLMLAGDVADRQSGDWPATAFAPVAATPDELAPGWHGGRLDFNLELHWNGKRFGLVAAGAGMQRHFGELIAQAAARRGVPAGGIVGSGPIRQGDPSRGFACLADKRAHELQAGGLAKTAFMAPADVVRIDLKGVDGHSLFGAIELRGVGTGAAGGGETSAVEASSELDVG